eukprot:1404527-Amphidinium_carterae.1
MPTCEMHKNSTATLQSWHASVLQAKIQTVQIPFQSAIQQNNRYLAAAEQQDLVNEAERRHIALTQPICGHDDSRPLLQLLLNRTKRQLVTCASLHYCMRGCSEASSGASSPADSVRRSDYSPSSLCTSRCAMFGWRSPSTPG